MLKKQYKLAITDKFLSCGQYKLHMRNILSERNIVVALFVMVLITFSMAQEDAKKMERMQKGGSYSAASNTIVERTEVPAADTAVVTEIK